MKNKVSAAALVLLVLVFTSYGLVAEAKPNGGNGLRPGVDFSGPHFNLNVHGVPSGVDKFENDSIGPGRHTVFIPIDGVDLNISYRFDFTLNWTVEDCDATEDGTVKIVLPAYFYNDTDGDGIDEDKLRVAYYMCYVVGLGKPTEGTILIVPEAVFNDTLTLFTFNQDKLEVTRKRGQPQWQNATDLFFVDAYYWNGTGYEEYLDTWVFDVPGLEGYWWDVSNTGIKHMQIRFYPVFR